MEIQALIRHHIRHNRRGVLAGSIMHCHTRHVHSVLLTKGMRIFYADFNHQLFTNAGNFDDMAIAFHPHHCDLTLIPLAGLVRNCIVEKGKGLGSFPIARYKYVSAITRGKMGFKKVGADIIRVVSFSDLWTGTPMKATDIHTVWVDQGQLAAWMVLEGKENRKYVNQCWSGSQLEGKSDDGLYKKMTSTKLDEILSFIEGAK